MESTQTAATAASEHSAAAAARKMLEELAVPKPEAEQVFQTGPETGRAVAAVVESDSAAERPCLEGR